MSSTKARLTIFSRFTRPCSWIAWLTLLPAMLLALEPHPADSSKSVSVAPAAEENPLSMPPVGTSALRLLTPSVLELTLVTTKEPDPARGQTWDFVSENGKCQLPKTEEFAVVAGNKPIAVQAIGFKRRVLYAPLKERDLRIANCLYLRLAHPVQEAQTVEVKNPDHKLWPPTVHFRLKNDRLRWSPVLHVNQTGYLPAYSKKAMIGYYLGNLGELDVAAAATEQRPERREKQNDRDDNPKDGKQGPPPDSSTRLTHHPFSVAEPLRRMNASPLTFRLLEYPSNKPAFEARLTPRPDTGFPYPAYQQVWEADFSEFKTPGVYRLFVPGLGTSFPFYVDHAVAGAFARTYALGLYHQRCGMANALPYTRFTHEPCHTTPAEVPDMSEKFASVNNSLAKESANCKENLRHTAPQLKDVAASLYPFVNHGPVDVHGGHHDAGDYSKYTINSAAFIHFLVFAADVFPGVSALDNLGLPESGDGKSDVLQEAKWEADFLARMQDADGGFYFLVYPHDREYEADVLPDHGDPQVVFPKTTSATAAASAALAQCASSPTFKKQFPQAATQYLKQAKKGWAFLERAMEKHGQDGAYQKITHYGDEFMHDDELAWAACELYLATGEEAYHKKLLAWLHPNDPNTRHWGWCRLTDAYGCAIRSYAFAAKAGKSPRERLDPLLLQQCEDEIAALGEDQLHRSEASAYGTSFPLETKRSYSAGWYFSSDAAFDLATAYQLDYPSLRDPRPKLLNALFGNLNYEQGCNPVNVTYLTGLGWKRQREIVHQYAQNDRRVSPPTGIPLGDIQSGLGWNYRYQGEPDKLSFPPDGAQAAPYPFYDRWEDGFNLSQEFVIPNQARALGYLAWLMAQTPLRNQPWKPPTATITGSPATLTAPGLDLSAARIVWEAKDAEPTFGKTFALPGTGWVEAEAQLPDGRRVFGVRE